MDFLPLAELQKTKKELNHRYEVRIYNIFLLFVLFFVYVLLIFPWVLSFNEIGSTVVKISIFSLLILPLIASYIFLITSKGVNWKI